MALRRRPLPINCRRGLIVKIPQLTRNIPVDRQRQRPDFGQCAAQKTVIFTADPADERLWPVAHVIHTGLSDQFQFCGNSFTLPVS